MRSVRVAKTMAIAGVYTALTIVLGYWSFGPLQFRIADAMLALPFLRTLGWEAIAGLTLGGFLGNIPSPFGFWDWFFGPVTNLGASIIFYIAGKAPGNRVIWLVVGGALSSLWIAFSIGYLELELVFSQPSWTFLAVFSSELIIILLFGSLIVKFAERMGL